MKQPKQSPKNKSKNQSKNQRVYSLDPTKIHTFSDRQRQIFGPRAMNELINSIKGVGQIQAGVCKKGEGNRIELVVGERRLRACEEIGIDFQFILKEEIDNPALLERIQLEENLIREDLEWKEEVRAKRRIFDLLKASDPRQTVESVATYLGIGKTLLSEDISLAVWIDENDEVAAAPNKTTAKKIAKRFVKVIVRDETLERTLKDSKVKTIRILKEGARKEGQDEKEIEELEDLTSKEARILLYDSQCILGDMEEKLLDFPDNHFDLVFFDPPWGVDYDEGQKGAENQKKFEDSKAGFLMRFPFRLKLLYEKMAEDSHIYIFFGIVNYDFIYKTIEGIGFKTSGLPLMWYKLGACRTRNPEWEYGRSYEPIAFARKGRKKLKLPPIGDIISTPQPTPTLKDIHPSAKHPEIYRKLLLQSGYPGDKVLDPMGGSGMMAVAAEDLRSELNLDWTQIEIDKDYRNLQFFNLTKGYQELTQTEEVDVPSSEERAELWSKAHPKPKIADDFHTLVAGSEDWKLYWKAHPEKQKEMLQWREQEKERRIGK